MMLTAVDQPYLFLARQLEALSPAVHIPLVCFGISFPAMVLFAEWRYLRTSTFLHGFHAAFIVCAAFAALGALAALVRGTERRSSTA